MMLVVVMEKEMSGGVVDGSLKFSTVVSFSHEWSCTSIIGVIRWGTGYWRYDQIHFR